MTMKQFLKYMCLVMLIGMAAVTGQARVINIDVNTVKTDLVKNLRERCARAAYTDTVVLNFGKGEYVIDGTIECKCNVIIKGLGSDKTTIVFNQGQDRNGFKAYTSDAFFKIVGKPSQQIAVSITDIGFGIKKHEGIWWTERERYAVKIYHANRVDVHNVDSYLTDAYITNLDLHVCSNVSITDCVFTNYNNCETGGCLWIRGEMHNITVKRNKFYKYGKDETLAIYDRLVDHTKEYVRGVANRTNIFVEDNEFHYGGYPGKKLDPEANCGMIFSLFTESNKSKDRCTTRNFHLRNNKFYVDEVTTRCIFIGFNPADWHEDISVENNQIINTAIKRDYRFYHQDIEVHDDSSCPDTIRILNNTVRNENVVINPSGSSAYTFLRVHGGNLLVQGNKVVNSAMYNPANGKAAGVRVLWCGAEGGDITMRDNVFKGVYYTGFFSSSKGADLVTFNARNNYFSGDTRIYCNNIKQVHINFTNNTLVSDNLNFFLEEFANKGTVVFNQNDVTVKDGKGQFMTHWSKGSSNKMRFDKLEVRDNVIRGIKSESDLFRNVTNVKKRKVSNNRISR